MNEKDKWKIFFQNQIKQQTEWKGYPSLQIGGIRDAPPYLWDILGEFTELEALEIYGACYLHYNDSLIKLQNLRKIIIVDSDLHGIPIQIFQLKNLEELLIHYRNKFAFKGNVINCLPNEIGDLAKLKKLYLIACDLVDLPMSLSKLSNLEILEIYGGGMEAIPKSIFSLNKLRHLNIMNNKISHFPQERLTELTSLETLYLAGNPINNLPSEFLEFGEDLNVLEKVKEHFRSCN